MFHFVSVVASIKDFSVMFMIKLEFIFLIYHISKKWYLNMSLLLIVQLFLKK